MKTLWIMIKRIFSFIMMILLFPLRVIYEIVDFLYLSDAAKKIIAFLYCMASTLYFWFLIKPDIHIKTEIYIFVLLDAFFCGVLLWIHFYSYDDVIGFLDIILTPVADFQSSCIDRVTMREKHTTERTEKATNTESHVYTETRALVDLEFFIHKEQVLHPVIPYCEYVAKPCDNKW